MRTPVSITLYGCPAGDDAWAFAARAAAEGWLPCVPDDIDHDAPLVHCHFDASMVRCRFAAIDDDAVDRDVTTVKHCEAR